MCLCKLEGNDYLTDGRILVALYAQAASTHTLLLIHHMVGATLLFPSVLLALVVPHPFFPSLPSALSSAFQIYGDSAPMASCEMSVGEVSSIYTSSPLSPSLPSPSPQILSPFPSLSQSRYSRDARGRGGAARSRGCRGVRAEQRRQGCRDVAIAARGAMAVRHGPRS